MRRLSIILPHLRHFTGLARDGEGVVAKKTIWGAGCLKKCGDNEHNARLHQHKLARNSTVTFSGVLSRTEKIWNNGNQRVVNQQARLQPNGVMFPKMLHPWIDEKPQALMRSVYLVFVGRLFFLQVVATSDGSAPSVCLACAQLCVGSFFRRFGRLLARLLFRYAQHNSAQCVRPSAW